MLEGSWWPLHMAAVVPALTPSEQTLDMSEAQKRAQARRAKILARGGDGLAQLAKSARGDEGAALYDTSFKSAKTSSPAQPTAAPKAAVQSSFGAIDSPDAYQAQMENMMRMLGGGGAGEGQGMSGMPDMAALQAMLGGGMGNASGDSPFPSLLQGPGGAADAPQSMPQSMNAPFPGMPGMDFSQMQAGPVNKPFIERFFPLIHALSTICLFLFVTLWWEPAVHSTRYGNLVSETSTQRWKSLLGSSPLSRTGATEILPVFWAFTTLQLLLQTTRFLVFKSPPAPHSLLQNFLPFLPPSISRPLLTGSRYLSLIAQTWKDGCLFIALLGLRIAIAAR